MACRDSCTAQPNANKEEGPRGLRTPEVIWDLPEHGSVTASEGDLLLSLSEGFDMIR